MQVEKKLLCHWDFVRFIREEHLTSKDGTSLTLSVTEGDKIEFMIFLGKDDANSGYEVRVYKAKPTDKYVPHELDNVKSYEENDEYATFFFQDFEKAIHFVDFLGYDHTEYRVRPIREIVKAN